MPMLELPNFEYSDDSRTMADKLNELVRQLEYGINREKSTTSVNFNNRNDRISTAIKLPTIATDGTAIDHTINADGSANISLEWAWPGIDAEIDGWNVYVHQADTNATYTFGDDPASEQVFQLPREKRAGFILGPANKFYTLGVQAYRVVDADVDPSGVIVTAIVQPTRSEENPYQPSANVAFTGDITGTVNGLAVANLTEARNGNAYAIQDCNALFHFDTHLKSTQGLAPVGTPVATLRPGEGKFGGAVAVEEGTINLVANGNCESTFPTLGGYNISQFGTAELSTKYAHYGTKSLHLQNPNNPWGGAWRLGNWGSLNGLVIGHTYTFSCYVYIPNNTNNAGLTPDKVIIFFFDSILNPLSNRPTKFDEWQRLEVTLTIQAGTTQVFPSITLNTTTSTHEIYVDDLQVEEKLFATSSVNGIRPAGSLKYPKSILNASEGTFLFWCKINKFNTGGAYNFNAILATGGDTNRNRFLIMRDVSDGSLKVWDSDDSTEVIYNSAPNSIVLNQWFSGAVTWGSVGRALYLNGQQVATNPKTSPISFSNADENIQIGTWMNAYFVNGLLDELRFDTKQRTAEEIKAWHDSGVPFVDPGQTQIADSVRVTEKGLEVTHFDGSYTLISWDGIKRYVAGTGKSYMYLTEAGTGASITKADITQVPDNVVVQLPSDFAGKDFKVVLGTKSFRSFSDAGVQITLDVVSYDIPNGRFTVQAYQSAEVLPNYYKYGIGFMYVAIA